MCFGVLSTSLSCSSLVTLCYSFGQTFNQLSFVLSIKFERFSIKFGSGDWAGHDKVLWSFPGLCSTFIQPGDGEKLTIRLIREEDLTPVFYSPFLLVFSKSQPGSYLRFIIKAFFRSFCVWPV